MTDDASRGGRTPHPWLLAAVLVLVGLAAYWPVLHAGFVWDDDAVLTRNPLIHAPDGWWRIWDPRQTIDYWPVTALTFWIQYHLGAVHAAAYHAINLAVYLLDGLVLWRLFARLGLPAAFLAALLFVVHPMNVESVAWIAERKNLLALLFFLVSIDAYVRGRTWLSLIAFAFGLLSKASIAPLPIVLLGVVAWRRPPTRRDLIRLLPFFILAAVFVALNVALQHRGELAAVRIATPLERILGAAWALAFYLGKALWPHPLVFIYPGWHPTLSSWVAWLPLMGAAVLTAVLWRPKAPSVRAARFAWGYFAVMLLPALGLTDVYFMRYSPVADHYAQLALIGVVGLLATGWSACRARMPGPLPLALVSAVVGIGAALAYRQCLAYHDAETLDRSVLARNPGAWLAHNNLGLIELGKGEREAALAEFNAALTANPAYAEAHINRARMALEANDPQTAAQECRAALERPSDFAREAHLNLGHAWFQLGRPADAAGEYRAALAIDPNYGEAHYSLGNVLFSERQPAAAAEEYRAALRQNPSDRAARENLDAALRAAKSY